MSWGLVSSESRTKVHTEEWIKGTPISIWHTCVKFEILSLTRKISYGHIITSQEIEAIKAIVKIVGTLELHRVSALSPGTHLPPKAKVDSKPLTYTPILMFMTSNSWKIWIFFYGVTTRTSLSVWVSSQELPAVCQKQDLFWEVFGAFKMCHKQMPLGRLQILKSLLNFVWINSLNL